MEEALCARVCYHARKFMIHFLCVLYCISFLFQVEVTPLQMREHVGDGPRSGGGMALRI